uniref:SAM-dependent MTase TRM10-type domain-containing protein n=1 Tax=Rhabditophanes sp. KR3021 TaxID=114890 RepID=A0AC35TWC4_9BILA
MSQLRPSAQLVAKLITNGVAKLVISKNIKKVQVAEFASDYFPDKISDEQWESLLQSNSTSSLLNDLQFLKKKSIKEEKDLLKKENKSGEIFTVEQSILKNQEKYDQGLNTYANGFHQLMTNPLRHKCMISITQAHKYWASQRSEETPHIIWDCLDTINSKNFKSKNIIGRQLNYVISENNSSTNVWPMTFCNFNVKEIEAQKFIKNSLGSYTNQYDYQRVMPDLDPRSAQLIIPEGKKVVYLSNKARKYIDGPLDADYYVATASFDKENESIRMARNANVEPLRLPIKKYVKWQAGSQYLPFSVMTSVLKEVFENGGDWSTAFHNNISKRHLRTHEEQVHISSGRKFKIDANKIRNGEIVQMMEDATMNMK